MTLAVTIEPMSDRPTASAEAASSTPGGDAETPPPATSATTLDVPAFGWSAYAERVNGRFAMVGFLAVVLVEAISGQPFLRWAGLMP
jgi:hypothetical protein